MSSLDHVGNLLTSETPSDLILSSDGEEIQKRLWFETMQRLQVIAPNISALAFTNDW